MSIRLRATVTVEYDADPEHYGTDDPAGMADLDHAMWERDALTMCEALAEGTEVKIITEPA